MPMRQSPGDGNIAVEGELLNCQSAPPVQTRGDSRSRHIYEAVLDGAALRQEHLWRRRCAKLHLHGRKFGAIGIPTRLSDMGSKITGPKPAERFPLCIICIFS